MSTPSKASGSGSKWLNRIIGASIGLGVIMFGVSMCNGQMAENKRNADREQAKVVEALKKAGVQTAADGQAIPVQQVQQAPAPPPYGYPMNGQSIQNGVNADVRPMQGPNISILGVNLSGGNAGQAAQKGPNTPDEEVIDQSPPPEGLQQVTAPAMSDASNPDADANCSSWVHMHQYGSGTSLRWEDFSPFRSGKLREECVDYNDPSKRVDVMPWENHYCISFRICSSGESVTTGYEFRATTRG